MKVCCVAAFRISYKTTLLGRFDLIRSLLPRIFKLLKLHKFFSVPELRTIRSSASATCGWTTCFRKSGGTIKAQTYTIFLLNNFFKYKTSKRTKNTDDGKKTWGGWCNRIGLHEVHPSKQGTSREVWGDCR